MGPDDQAQLRQRDDRGADPGDPQRVDDRRQVQRLARLAEAAEPGVVELRAVPSAIARQLQGMARGHRTAPEPGGRGPELVQLHAGVERPAEQLVPRRDIGCVPQQVHHRPAERGAGDAVDHDAVGVRHPTPAHADPGQRRRAQELGAAEHHTPGQVDQELRRFAADAVEAGGAGLHQRGARPDQRGDGGPLAPAGHAAGNHVDGGATRQRGQPAAAKGAAQRLGAHPQVGRLQGGEHPVLGTGQRHQFIELGLRHGAIIPGGCDSEARGAADQVCAGSRGPSTARRRRSSPPHPERNDVIQRPFGRYSTSLPDAPQPDPQG
ncbi:MAG: hypothetical protein AB7Q92_20405 [Acidimicrobiia bacterium]